MFTKEKSITGLILSFFLTGPMLIFGASNGFDIDFNGFLIFLILTLIFWYLGVLLVHNLEDEKVAIVTPQKALIPVLIVNGFVIIATFGSNSVLQISVIAGFIIGVIAVIRWIFK
jgi:hypothetical protein